MLNWTFDRRWRPTDGRVPAANPQSATTAAQPPWHARAAAAVAAELGSDPGGLSTQDAAARRSEMGFNELAQAPPTPRWKLLVRQFHSAVVWLLIIAAIVSGAMGQWSDTAAILAIVVLNGLLGFWQEDKSRRALEALEKLSAPLAHVMRDGQLENIPARELVPGDRIRLEAGDLVGADARLLDAVQFTVQEAALTGESGAVDKDALAVLGADTPLADRRNMVYLATTIATGKAEAVVVATGMQTELGRIAGLLSEHRSEPTPLERRLDELGKVLMLVCLVLVAIIFSLEVWRGGELVEVFLTAVSLAVAAVPEGLPAVVTMSLALGLQRMIKRNALVRKLPSVETLGSVTVICSDKTGTLTRNEMTVCEIVAGARRYRVTGVGFDPRGQFFPVVEGGQAASPAADQPLDARTEVDLAEALAIGAGCTTAQLHAPRDAASPWRVVGDPTEAALIVAARKAGLDEAGAASGRRHEIPFDSQRKAMSIVIAAAGAQRMLTKGAPEVLLAHASHEQIDGHARPLGEERRAEWLRLAAEMAGRAMRVLAVATRTYPADHQGPFPETDLTFVGLFGLVDPPREEVKSAVHSCKLAGIRPIMITGDHPATAGAIARELKIADGGRVVSGQELDAMSDAELAAEVDRIAVYARVAAQHKQRIVQALKTRGEIVAMTGDGVNDAPAVSIADIGIAMGISGTDVTKAASDMVLTDDNFASIVGAVEEGRGIFDNIQHVVHYLLSCNAGEVLFMFVAALLDWPMPLLPVHLLWINLITDGLPALTLGMERPQADIMARPPRPPREPVITWQRGRRMVAYGVLFATTMAVGFAYVRWDENATVESARTVAFCIACYSQMFFAFGCRSETLTFPELGPLSNSTMLAAMLASGVLQLATVLSAAGRTIFLTALPTPEQWIVIFLLSLVPVTILELVKSLPRQRNRPAADGLLPGGKVQ